MRITADLIARLYLNNKDEIPKIINSLIKAATGQKSSTIAINRLFAILHLLASRFSDQLSIDLAKKIFEENDKLLLYDIENWMTTPGFAGHFNSFEEAYSHGCGHYAVSSKQRLILDLFEVNKTLETYEINTRHQRLQYAASLAIAKRQSIKVIDLGGGSGSYYILLRRLFPDVHFDYTCIDFDELRPLNADEIDNDFYHVPTIQQCKEPESCDLFIASGVLQYMSDKERDEVNKILGLSRVSLLDRCPCTNAKSFWTIQTRADCRHPCKIFNLNELSDIANSSKNRSILAEGICPEDWFRIFNMEELCEENLTQFKWYVTYKLDSFSLDDFVIF